MGGEYQWLANFGFAAIVAIYTLTRLEKAVWGMTKQLRLNSILLAKITGLDFFKLEKDHGNGNSNSDGR